MSAWVTAGLTEPGVRLGSGSTAPAALTVIPPVVSAGRGVVDVEAGFGFVVVAVIDGTADVAALLTG
jgi:hypothetical protein